MIFRVVTLHKAQKVQLSTKITKYMYWFGKAAERKYCKVGGLNNRNLLTHSSGAQKSDIEVFARLAYTEDCDRESVSFLSTSYW